ncbi:MULTISPECIES: acetyltransferase [unclassified Microcoleus]|uniref:acetyltransferase n=1 Tax=unclassified Microcoleus TaxID=2642155 RepID=UPI002FD6E8B7
MNTYLYGCGGHAKVIIDILSRHRQVITGIVDDNPPQGITEIYGTPIYLAAEKLIKINTENSQWIAAIGNNRTRQYITQKITNLGYSFTTAIHPSAQIALGVEIASGTVIMANTAINTETKINHHVIINTGTTIDHDCIIDDYCHIAPGCSLAGQVRLGRGVLLGVGTKVCPGVEIGDGTTCGAGSVVIHSLPSHCLAYGCPAKIVDRNYFP